MPVSSGSFTVGSGGDYATISAALGDTTATLTGDLTFTIISNIVQSTITSFPNNFNPDGNTFRLTADTSHDGDPTAGRIVSWTASTDMNIEWDGSATGTIEIDNFVVRIPSSAGGTARIFSVSPSIGTPRDGAVTFKLHDVCCRTDDVADLFREWIRLNSGTDGGYSPDDILVIYNMKLGNWEEYAFYVDLGVGRDAGTIIFENISAYADGASSVTPNGYLINHNGSGTVTVRNCYFGGSADDGGMDMPAATGAGAVIFENCATKDASAKGTGAVTSVPDSDFTSITPSNSGFLALVANSDLEDAGATPEYSIVGINDVGISGGIRDIGAEEFEQSDSSESSVSGVEPSSSSSSDDSDSSDSATSSNSSISDDSSSPSSDSSSPSSDSSSPSSSSNSSISDDSNSSISDSSLSSVSESSFSTSSVLGQSESSLPSIQSSSSSSSSVIIEPDPRIRGLVDRRGPRFVPTIDRRVGVSTAINIRVGSVVMFNGQRRVVQYVNFSLSGRDTIQVPGARYVTSINLGGQYTKVPLDQITVVKF